jgi:catechol 2,3-dioxygenase-like lactoylglutathione lyase family enzyme
MLNAHLSHVSLGCADVLAARRFYEDHVGLSVVDEDAAGVVRMGLGAGAHVLELRPGGGLDHFALEVADAEALASLERRLGGAGVQTTWTSAGSGHERALVFDDPDGHRIEFHGRIDRRGEGLGDPGRRPVRLHHVTVTTPDVPALVAFYADTLGFAVSDRMGDRFAWLRCNREHHTVAIVEGPSGGLDHYCYEVACWNDLKTWCDELAAGGVLTSWGPGRHGPGNNLFIMFDDPDEVHIELSCEMERFWDDRVEYAGPRTWAADARTVNLWGPAPEWRKPVTSAGTGA